MIGQDYGRAYGRRSVKVGLSLRVLHFIALVDPFALSPVGVLLDLRDKLLGGLVADHLLR